MRLDHLLSKEHYFLPTVVGVLVECTCVVLPTIFFNRVETHLKQEQLIVIYTVWFLKKYLVHCWVSGALLSWCCLVADAIMVCCVVVVGGWGVV